MNLKIKIKNLEIITNYYKSLTNENIQIKNRLKIIEDYLKQNKNITKKINQFFDLDKSYILQNEIEKNKLEEWISVNGEIKKINLLYRAREDGEKAEIFYNKCAYKGSTISLIKTTKGRRFGGFSKVEWVKGDKRIRDNNAFLFSLDKMEKYKILKPQYAIASSSDGFYLIYGNNLDGCGIYLFCFNSEKKATENHSTRVYDVPSDYSLSGYKNFDIEEFEVYQILFE